MNEVYVLFGKMIFSDDVDKAGTDTLEVFDSFEKALTKMKECIHEAYSHMSECNMWVAEEFLPAELDEEILFSDYDPEYDDGDYHISWTYEENETSADWQVTIESVDVLEDCAVMPWFKVCKEKIQ